MAETHSINGTLIDFLGIKVSEAAKDRVVVTMPVTRRAHQPMGLMHGGVSLVLAETAASVGAWMNVDQTRQRVVGMEINANHLRAKREGRLTATAKPLYVGRTTMVWEVRITDEKDLLICASRCTLAVVDREHFND